MDYMKKTDLKAFITVYSVSGINYTPKKWQKIHIRGADVDFLCS